MHASFVVELGSYSAVGVPLQVNDILAKIACKDTLDMISRLETTQCIYNT